MSANPPAPKLEDEHCTFERKSVVGSWLYFKASFRSRRRSRRCVARGSSATTFSEDTGRVVGESVICIKNSEYSSR